MSTVSTVEIECRLSDLLTFLIGSSNLVKIMLTFAMIKPHAVANPVALEHILRTIQQNNFVIVKKSRIQFNREMAENFYGEHRGKFYFNRLVTFMMR